MIDEWKRSASVVHPQAVGDFLLLRIVRREKWKRIISRINRMEKSRFQKEQTLATMITLLTRDGRKQQGQRKFCILTSQKRRG